MWWPRDWAALPGQPSPSAAPQPHRCTPKGCWVLPDPAHPWQQGQCCPWSQVCHPTTQAGTVLHRRLSGPRQRGLSAARPCPCQHGPGHPNDSQQRTAQEGSSTPPRQGQGAGRGRASHTQHPGPTRPGLLRRAERHQPPPQPEPVGPRALCVLQHTERPLIPDGRGCPQRGYPQQKGLHPVSAGSLQLRTAEQPHSARALRALLQDLPRTPQQKNVLLIPQTILKSTHGLSPKSTFQSRLHGA